MTIKSINPWSWDERIVTGEKPYKRKDDTLCIECGTKISEEEYPYCDPCYDKLHKEGYFDASF